MNRSSGRMAIFNHPRDYQAFLSLLAEALDLHAVELMTFCVMPNHWHLVLRAERGPDLSAFMHWLTTTHARRWRLRHNTVGHGPVYKSRYLSVPVHSEVELVRVCRYVERNPVKAGLARRAQDWAWSSVAERRRRRRRIALLSAPFLESESWLDYVNVASDARDVVAIERLESMDRPLGVET